MTGGDHRPADEHVLNTGIATYVWVLSNRKPSNRRGKVQFIDATAWFKPLRKNLGKKNWELADADIDRIVETFLKFDESEQSRIFDNAEFGYSKVTVERPLARRGRSRSPAGSRRSSAARYCCTRPTPGSTRPRPPSAARSALPAFYKSRPLRPLEAIRADILALERGNRWGFLDVSNGNRRVIAGHRGVVI